MKNIIFFFQNNMMLTKTFVSSLALFLSKSITLGAIKNNLFWAVETNL